MKILKHKKIAVIFCVSLPIVIFTMFTFYPGDKLFDFFYPREMVETKDINNDMKAVAFLTDTAPAATAPLATAPSAAVPSASSSSAVAVSSGSHKDNSKKNVKIEHIALVNKESSVVNIVNSGSIPKKLLNLAVTAYNNASEKRLVNNHKLTIIDYSLPSNQKRLWLVDMDKKRVELHTYVSHGLGSGNKKMAKEFSNLPNSHKSSLGIMKTGGIYHGHNGTSLYLHGLEKNINDNVYKRHIVMHGAHYVNDSVAKNLGCVGRSFGCPAIDYRLVKTVINKIANGSIVFVYYPNKSWLNNSRFL